MEQRATRLHLLILIGPQPIDAKWRQLESILDEPIMLDAATGLRRLGDPAAVVVVHGGIAREARRAAIAAFNSDPVVRVMVANDAAGEGVNLQRGAHLMVNYDKVDPARAPFDPAFVVGASAVGCLPGSFVRATRGRSIILAGPIPDRGGAGRRTQAAPQIH
jgi:hypothetical protein